MKSSNELRTMLRAIDHKSYPAYRSLAGEYRFGTYVLVIDHVQGDPFASPSALHLEIPWKQSGFPEELRDQDCKRIALQDHLTRLLSGKGLRQEWSDLHQPVWAGGFGAKRL